MDGRAFRVALTAFAAAWLVALPASAPAARRARHPKAVGGVPFTLDASEAARKPDVAVDESGTGHFVWDEHVNVVGSDDVIHYCQVPRGQRSCSHALALPGPEEDFGGPRILLPGDGRVLIVTSRCCGIKGTFSGTGQLLYASNDGGASFSPPVLIGDNSDWISGSGGGIALGPGNFSLSTISDITTGGVVYQADPLTGPPPEHTAFVGEIPGTIGAGEDSSIAFVDSLTPIVAMSDGDNVYFRRFAGGTSYNDIGAWGPLTPVAAGSEPQLGGLPSGRRGVHMLMRLDKPDFHLVARTYDGTNFVDQVRVSENGYPISRNFFMDPSGRLHAVWVENDGDSLLQRISNSGNKWEGIETLLAQGKADNVYNLRAAAAADGGGFAVFDGNDHPPIRAVAIAPAGKRSGSGGTCPEKVKVGGATVLAKVGCLKARGDGRYTTSKDVRVNGIDLSVGGASSSSSARASSTKTITIDTKQRTIETSAPVLAAVGSVKLDKERIEWRIPAGKGQIKDLAGNPATFETSHFGTRVVGLAVSGYTVPKLVGGEKVAIQVRLGLPQPLASALGEKLTAETVLRASNNDSLDLTGLKLDVGGVWLGIAQVKDFHLTYVNDPFLLQGSTEIVLPVVGSKLGVAFGLREGHFDFGRGSYEFPAGQLPVATGVLLRKIEFEVSAGGSCAKPTKIGGGVRFTSAPEVSGASLIAVDGTVAYAFPLSSCGKPGVLNVTGAGSFAGFPVSSLAARLTTEGDFTFQTGLGVDLTVASAGFDLDGGISIPHKTFYADGNAHLNFGPVDLGGNALVSSTGLAACANLFLWVEAGFHYRWGETPGLGNFDFPPDCEFDESEFLPAGFPRRARTSAAVPTGSFKLPGGLPSATVRIDGDGAPPPVTVHGPGGLIVSAPDPAAGISSGHNFGVAASGNQTFVRIGNPPAGSYSVSAAGATAITAVAVAKGLPKPKIGGEVTKPRGRGLRVLTYRARRLGHGERLLFVEDGAHGFRNVLGSGAGRRGSLRFRTTGPHGKRTVFALVERHGMPREIVRVARYVAPGPLLPSRPRALRLRRRGSKLVVSWSRAAGAPRYAVGWALRDGRRRAAITHKHSFTLRAVPGIDAGRITVAGLRRDNVAGPRARAHFRPHPKHPRHRHRHRRGHPRRHGHGHGHRGQRR